MAVQTLSVLLGNGDGTFGPRELVRPGRSGSPIVASADFNGDKIPDLVVNQLASGLLLLLGNGDGTFRAPQSIATGGPAMQVAVGDFNGDRIPDLALITGIGSTELSVLLGNGDGTFRLAQRVAIGPFPSFVAVGDFNGDRRQDLAVVRYSRYLSVLLGNGDGTFGPARDFEIGTGLITAIVADFDNDGRLDVAVTETSDRPQASRVHVMLGRGDGTFLAPRSFAVGSSPRSIAAGDFNGDRILDLAVSSLGSNPDYYANVLIFLGEGNGAFRSAQFIEVAGGAWEVAVADFDGDGRLDLAVLNRAAGHVRVLRGVGNGRFRSPVYFGAGGEPNAMVVEDFDGDGLPDLAVAHGGSGGLSVLMNNTAQASSNQPGSGPLK